MTVTDKDLRENTTPANGANPQAVAEAKTHAAQQVPISKWPAVSMTVNAQSMMGMLTIKEGAEIFLTMGGKPLTVRKDTVVRPLRRSPDGQWFYGIVEGTGNHNMYLFRQDAVIGPNAAIAKQAGTRAPRMTDELATAAQAAAETVGKMPLGVSSKDKTPEQWAEQFKGCTIANVAAALIAIQAFRVDRATKIAAAQATGNEQDLIAAIKEYRAAKSWEQDVFSTAGNCGLI